MKQNQLSIILLIVLTLLPLSLKAKPSFYMAGSDILGDSNVVNAKTMNSSDKNALQGYRLGIGVVPTSGLPIISNFRFEFQYGELFDQGSNGMYMGGSIYYDLLKFIPFVNPYIGASLGGYKAGSFTYINNDGDKTQTSAYKDKYGTFLAGLTFKLPWKIQIFAEYEYTVGMKPEGDGYIEYTTEKGRYRSQQGVFGVRYFFL